MNEPSQAGGQRPGIGRIAAITITVAAILGIAWLLVELAGFLLLVFASLVIAAVFDASARQVTRFTRLGHGLALTISILALLAMFVGGFILFGSQLANQFDTIRDSIPPALDQVEAFLDRAGLGEPARELLDQGSGDVSRLAAQAGGYLLSAGSGLANFLLVFVGAIFIASDPAVPRIPPRMRSTMRRADCAAGWWGRRRHRWRSRPRAGPGLRFWACRHRAALGCWPACWT
jgi:predicted PurR-regulated permease PerM